MGCGRRPLFEIGRIKTDSQTILNYLKSKIGLKIDDKNFKEIINTALKETWTRDTFDRIITAHAKYRDAYLISKDARITKNYFKTLS
ncbi:MAG: hypothetical protein KAW12_23455 [Candidatus Aminicenantes bacterium]|nr:hypothetical protein [Candidatus Aminicenantes bacterium]